MTTQPNAELSAPVIERVVRERRRLLAAVFVGVITAAIFLPSLSNGFVNWDDNINFESNPAYRGLGWTHLRWMFTTAHSGPYQPLSWMTLGLDYLIWDMNPLGYHLTNVLLHAIAAGLFCLVAAELFTAPRGGQEQTDIAPRGDVGPLAFAVCAALLWALHPLRVEGVTWVTERREVLCGVLSLAAILHALRRGVTLTTTCWALAAMLAKATAVTLPVLLLLAHLYRARPTSAPAVLRESLAAMRRLAPMIVAAVVVSGVAIWAQRASAATVGMANLGVANRLRLFGYGLSFYATRTLWPVNLLPFYESPNPLNVLTVPAVLGAAGVALALIVGWLFRRSTAAVWTAAIGYAVMILPVGGLIQVGSQCAADRYSYQPTWLVTLLIAAVLWSVLQAILSPRGATVGLAAVTLAACVLLAQRTVLQQRIWQDSGTLWRHQLAIAPASVAHQNYASWLTSSRQPDADTQAEKHYREAVRLIPFNVDAHTDLGSLLMRTGRPTEALASFRDALKWTPNHPHALYGEARVLWELGRQEEALDAFRRLAGHSPREDDQLELARVLAAVGDVTGAIQHYRATIEKFPRSTAARAELAWLLATHPDRDHRDGAEAVRLARQAWEMLRGPDMLATSRPLKLSETAAAAVQQVIQSLAAAYAESGDFDNATSFLAQAARLLPQERAGVLEAMMNMLNNREPIRVPPRYEPAADAK